MMLAIKANPAFLSVKLRNVVLMDLTEYISPCSFLLLFTLLSSGRRNMEPVHLKCLSFSLLYILFSECCD